MVLGIRSSRLLEDDDPVLHLISAAKQHGAWEKGMQEVVKPADE